jgi:F-type H+-transporting ATPase subunit delta
LLRAEDKGLVQGYAEALFGLAVSQKQEDKLQEDLFSFKQAMDKSYDLKEFMGNRRIAPAVKRAALKELISADASPLLVSILDAMIVNDRAYLVGDVIDNYLEAMKAKKKRVIAEVSTAIPLTGDLNAKVVKRLSDATGYDVVVSNTVNKEVLGGMVVKMEGKVLDASTKKKLADLKKFV